MAFELIRKCRDHSRALLQSNADYIRGGFERHRETIARGGANVPADEILREAPCCFVLSTGRCGTGLLTRILSASARLWPVHHPSPGLIYASARAYQQLDEDPDAIRFAALSARFDLVWESYVRGRMLVETHNRITCFCPALSEIFSRSKFIHLVRHPGDYARSGLRRGYYSPWLVHDGLWQPRGDDPTRQHWGAMNRIEKVAWLWNEVQGLAEDFKERLDEGRILTVRSEDLYSEVETTRSIFRFLDIDNPLPANRLTRLLRRPVNAQKTGNLPPYAQWPESDKASLRRWATQASTYGYDLR